MYGIVVEVITEEAKNALKFILFVYSSTYKFKTFIPKRVTFNVKFQQRLMLPDHGELQIYFYLLISFYREMFKNLNYNIIKVKKKKIMGIDVNKRYSELCRQLLQL